MTPISNQCTSQKEGVQRGLAATNNPRKRLGKSLKMKIQEVTCTKCIFVTFSVEA